MFPVWSALLFWCAFSSCLLAGLPALSDGSASPPPPPPPPSSPLPFTAAATAGHHHHHHHHSTSTSTVTSSAANSDDPNSINSAASHPQAPPLSTLATINTTIGFLINLHSIDDSGQVCGKLNAMTVQQLLAAQWAVSVVNEPASGPVPPVHMDVAIYDTCSDEDTALRDVFFALRHISTIQKESDWKSRYLGFIGVGDSEIVGNTAMTLHAFKEPLILASPKLAEMVKQKGNILTTAPDLSSVARPIALFAAELGLRKIRIITSCPHTEKVFKNATAMFGIKSEGLKLAKKSSKIGEVVRKFLDETNPGDAVAMILEPEEIEILVNSMKGYNMKRILLITGSVGLNKSLLKLWKNMFAESYFVEPHMPELPAFRDYFLEKLQEAKNSEGKSILKDYLSAIHNCSWENSCKSLTASEIANHLYINPEVNFVVKAVSAFSAALYLALRKRCDESSSVCDLSSPLHEDILLGLSQLSMAPSNSTAPFQLPGTSIKLTHDGHMISSRFVYLRVGSAGDLTILGSYSDDLGLNVSTKSARRQISQEKRGRGFDDNSFSRLPYPEQFPMETRVVESDEGDVNVRPLSYHFLSGTWVMIVISFASVGILFTLFILLYVLVKLCNKTIVGNQSFGIILLLGIGITYASVILFVLPTSELVCSLRLFVYPLSLSLCYGILIVKLMQLKTLVLLGLGGRISYLNQYLILFFIILVQFVISVQWFTEKGTVKLVSEKSLTCHTSETDFLILHSYIMALALLAFLYGLTILKVRRNYKEGRWITLSALLSVLVMAEWTAFQYIGHMHVQERAVCVALIILPSILLFTIFLPKINTISKQSSYLKRKKLNAASTSTVFTTFSELHSQSNKGNRDQWSHVDYCGTMSKNPLYEPSVSAYL